MLQSKADYSLEWIIMVNIPNDQWQIWDKRLNVTSKANVFLSISWWVLVRTFSNHDWFPMIGKPHESYPLSATDLQVSGLQDMAHDDGLLYTKRLMENHAVLPSCPNNNKQ